MGGRKWAKIIRYYSPALSSSFSVQGYWNRASCFTKRDSNEEKENVRYILIFSVHILGYRNWSSSFWSFSRRKRNQKR